MALATDLAPERTLQRCDVLNGHLEKNEKISTGSVSADHFLDFVVVFCNFEVLETEKA